MIHIKCQLQQSELTGLQTDMKYLKLLVKSNRTCKHPVRQMDTESTGVQRATCMSMDIQWTLFWSINTQTETGQISSHLDLMNKVHNP